MIAPTGSYDIDDARKTLSFLCSDDFKGVYDMYKKLSETDTRRKYIEKLQENRLDKYKTVEEVRKYIFSLKDKIETQAVVINELNNRNTMLSEFVIKNAINAKITAQDMIELSDGYSEKFDKLLEKIGVQEDKKKEKYDYETIDNTIKALKEPSYEYEEEQYPF